MNYKSIIKPEILKEIKSDKRVLAVLLFGSYARNEYYRDIDVCLILNKKYSNKEMFDTQIKYSAIFLSKFDVKVFQELPLYIRQRILKEGKVIYCKYLNELYELAFSTIKEFELYEKLYNLCLEKIKNG